LKATVSGCTDLAILEECERAEDVAKARYRKALEETLPEDIRAVVQRQYDGVMRNHDQIRDLCDAIALSKPDGCLAEVPCCRARMAGRRQRNQSSPRAPAYPSPCLGRECRCVRSHVRKNADHSFSVQDENGTDIVFNHHLYGIASTPTERTSGGFRARNLFTVNGPIPGGPAVVPWVNPSPSVCSTRTAPQRSRRCVSVRWRPQGAVPR
jgi:hypothetical protein